MPRLRVVGPAVVVLLATLGYAFPAEAQTVLASKRLGNNTEGITFLKRGREAAGLMRGPARTDAIAVMDGYDVLEVSLGPQTGAPVPHHADCDPSRPGNRRGCRRLFDVRHLGVAPRGILYIAGQDRFYFSAFDPTVLHAATVTGAPLPPLSIQYLPGTDPGQIVQFEGLAYIPDDAPEFPGTIAALTLHSNFVSHVQIIGLDGIVQHEIAFPEGSPLSRHLTGVTYRAPGRLLLSPIATNEIHEATFGGDFSGPVASVAPAASLEGLTTLDDGRVVAAAYADGMLRVLDSNLQRQPTEDREFQVGLGISRPFVAWDSDRDEFLLTALSANGGIAAVSAGLNTSRQVVDFAGTPFAGQGLVVGLAYLPDEGLIAAATPFGPGRGVGFFDSSGAYVSRISLPEPDFPADQWVPLWVAPLPEGVMALRLRGSTELRVITRTGAPDPSDPTAIVPTALAPIALSSAPGGGGLAAHVTAAGDLELIAGRSFYDLGGNLLRTYDSNALGLAQISSVAPITSGRYRGNFVATDVASSELVVFSLP